MGTEINCLSIDEGGRGGGGGGVKNYLDTKDGGAEGRRIASPVNRAGIGAGGACLPAKLHLHNRHAVGYRSTSGVSSSRFGVVRLEQRTHSLTCTHAARIKFRPGGAK